jgi:hypothetical protein
VQAKGEAEEGEKAGHPAVISRRSPASSRIPASVHLDRAGAESAAEMVKTESLSGQA